MVEIMIVSSFRRRTSGALVLATSIVLGTAGAVLAYRTVAGPTPAPASAPPAVTLPSAAAEPVQQKPVIRLAPCKAPAVLERGTCVTRVVREVVVPAPAAPAAAAAGRTSDEGRSGGERGGERRAASRGSDDRDRSEGDRDEREDRDDRDDRDEDHEDHEDREDRDDLDEDHEDHEDHEEEDHEDHEDD